MSTSRFFLLLVLLSCFSCFLFYFSFLDQIVYRNTPHVLQRNISILLWHWPFGISYRLDGNKCLELYNISGCFLTDNTSTLSTADVVVFHHQELSNGLSMLPLHLGRPASQHWVWLSMEPPINNSNLTLFNGLFNWTMSYRRDADIYIPYGKTIPGRSHLSDLTSSDRLCLVSWVVSKYKNQQARAQVYQSLKNYIPIEVYGKWTKRPLTNKKLVPTIAKCLFYLAFENSVATDYISEKLWRNSFQAGVVPVVLGPSRATYEALAPPNSFIHVADFKSTADLAAYLKHLAVDRKSYEAYLQWHRTHTVQTYTDWRERLCQICVQYPSLQTRKVYQDLAGWVNK